MMPITLLSGSLNWAIFKPPWPSTSMGGITIDPVSTLDSRLALVEIDTKDQLFCFLLRLMSQSMSGWMLRPMLVML